MRNKLTQTAAAVAVLVVLGIIGTAFNPQPATAAQGAAPVTIVNSSPVPVSIASPSPIPVSIASASPVPVLAVSPANAFSLPPQQVSLSAAGAPVAPDPSGTRYAISSVVVSNPTGADLELTIQAMAGTASTCRFIFNATGSAPGPKLTVQPHSTASLNFPQPYVTDAVTGAQICLVASGDNFIGTNWSAVGYKILP